MDRPRHLWLAGGGTGGHVFPGLVIADEMVRRGWSVTWLGRQQGMERDLVTRRDMDYRGFPAAAVVGRGRFAKIGALGTTALSALKVRRLVRRRDGGTVLGTGGYVSAPAVLGAHWARRPVFLFEPNAHAGAANRWLARFATGCFLGYAETATQLGVDTLHTGIPVRPEFFSAGDLPDGPPRILVLGGSQGAKQINRLVPAALEMLFERGSLAGSDALAVVHQTGAAHIEAVESDYRKRDLAIALDVVPFLDDVASSMASAHLVVSRAGALTLAEICAAGRPSVLIPLELAAGHQLANARRLSDVGAAELLTAAADDESAVERLAELFSGLLRDRSRLEAMAGAARSLARPDAAVEIADALEKAG